MKPKKTLNEAVVVVLKEANNEWMELEAIANAVNEKKLYIQKNGQPVTVDQIKARTLTQSYKQQFEPDGTKIRLRDEKHNDRKGNIVT